jgi:hypothetical protein
MKISMSLGNAALIRSFLAYNSALGDAEQDGTPKTTNTAPCYSPPYRPHQPAVDRLQAADRRFFWLRLGITPGWRCDRLSDFPYRSGQAGLVRSWSCLCSLFQASYSSTAV